MKTHPKAWLALAFVATGISAGRAADESGFQILRAAGVEVRLQVSPRETTTAGAIAADLEVTALSDFSIEIHPPKPQAFGQLTLVSETAEGPVMIRPGVLRFRHRAVFTPFLAGTYAVPAFAVDYRSAAGAGRLQTAPVAVDVRSVLGGDPALATPAPLLPDGAAPPPAEESHRVWLFAGVLALAGSWLLFRRSRRNAPALESVASPHARALGLVEALSLLDVAALERALEPLRGDNPEPLPGELAERYQWIRFGAPTAGEWARFVEQLKNYLRKEVR